MAIAACCTAKPKIMCRWRAKLYMNLRAAHPATSTSDDQAAISVNATARQDEIGTPFCVTIDFDTLGETPDLKDTVTLRHRDSGDQERLTVDEVKKRILDALA